MTCVEHLNITVPDIDVAIEFIQTVAPDFTVRKDEQSEHGYRWTHVGNEISYLALQEPHPGFEAKSPHRSYENYGVNHIGLIIDDAIATEKKLLAKGYKPSGPMMIDTYRKRLYFYDHTGLEWELVEYLSEVYDEKYLYE